MADDPRRLAHVPDPELERSLGDLGQHVAYPPTPDLARAVRARLGAASPEPEQEPPWWRRTVAGATVRRVAAAVVVIVVVAVAVLAVVPGWRSAVAHWLGVPGIRIELVTSTPTPARTFASPVATPVPTPTPVPLGSTLLLGDRVTLAEARPSVPFPLRVPMLPSLGPPDEVYVRQLASGKLVTFLYRARPGLPPEANTDVGLIVMQFQSEGNAVGISKGLLSPGTVIEEVDVSGNQGFWVAGTPHLVAYPDLQGGFPPSASQVAGNVLVWSQAGLTFRLEGEMTKEEALRIAGSMRPVPAGTPIATPVVPKGGVRGK